MFWTCHLSTDSVYTEFVGYNLKVSHCRYVVSADV